MHPSSTKTGYNIFWSITIAHSSARTGCQKKKLKPFDVMLAKIRHPFFSNHSAIASGPRPYKRTIRTLWPKHAHPSTSFPTTRSPPHGDSLRHPASPTAAVVGSASAQIMCPGGDGLWIIRKLEAAHPVAEMHGT